MSRRGDCWDNAVAESFFATLEHELLALETFATRRAAQHALFEFIEVWYNRQRRHTSLGSISPVQFEAEHRAA
jgi:transposase InsO family protein